jgi:hypothetical protein
MMPSDPIQAMEFAQSKGQARKDGKTGISFGDIAGMEATKKELQEVVEVSLCQELNCIERGPVLNVRLSGLEPLPVSLTGSGVTSRMHANRRIVTCSVPKVSKLHCLCPSCSHSSCALMS